MTYPNPILPSFIDSIVKYFYRETDVPLLPVCLPQMYLYCCISAPHPCPLLSFFSFMIGSTVGQFDFLEYLVESEDPHFHSIK